MSTSAVLAAVLAVSPAQVARAVPSADGSVVAFTVTSGGVSRLWTMAPDGTDPAELTGQPTGSNTDPATSPDGTKIAFTSDNSGNADIWVLDLVGGTSTQITTDPGADSAAAWSADGNTIAFQSDRSGNMDVWLMNPDGSSETQLTHNTASDSQPAWFPKSRRIAFQSTRSGNADIWAENANGTSVKRLTTSTAPDIQPSVNPSGTLVAFTSRRSNNTDIYTVPVAGGTNTRVSSNAAVDNQPAFSTDGRYLSFTSTRSGRAQVWRVPRPSGTSVQLTHGTDPAGGSDWLPYPYPADLWASRHEGSTSDGFAGYAVASSPNSSRSFVTGAIFESGAEAKGFVAAYDSAGAELWEKEWSDAGAGAGYSVAVSPDGKHVFVAGYSGAYLYVAKFSAPTGALQNSNILLDGSSTLASSIVVSSDGTKVFLAGTYYDLKGLPLGAITLAMNSSLSGLWGGVASYGKTDPALGSLRLSPDETMLYWSGVQYGTPVTDYTKNNYVTVGYRTLDGFREWATTYNGPGNSEDDAWSLAVAPDGGTVYVTGFSMGTGSSLSDQATLAYAASDGTQQWVSRFDSPNHGWDWAFSLGISPDGSTLYTGGSRSRTVSSKLTYDMLATSISADNGSLNWSAFYDGPGDYTGTAGFDTTYSVDPSPDGSRVFLSGVSFRTGASFDYTSLAFDASGNRIWLARYDGPSHDVDLAQDAVLSPDGSTLVVTGGSVGTYLDAATVAWQVSGCVSCRRMSADHEVPATGIRPQSGWILVRPSRPFHFGARHSLRHLIG